MDNFKKYEEIESVLLYGKLNKKIIPKISVVIPTYKRKKLLQETLESVINQKDYDDYEIIIVDNDEDFNNLEIEKIIENCKNEKIYYYKNKKNLGAAGNWNRCIELSLGKWIVMIHDDDLMKKNALNTINYYISKYNCSLLHFEYITKDYIKNKTIISSSKKIKIEKILLERFLCNPQILAPICTAFKKENAINVGGFDEKKYPSIDYDFWIRYIEKSNGLYVKYNPISIYRIEYNDSLRKDVVIGGIIKDYYIIDSISCKFKTQVKLSKYNLLWRIYKKKNLSMKEKKDIMEKLDYKKIDLAISFLLRKLKIIKMWDLYQKYKIKKASKEYN